METKTNKKFIYQGVTYNTVDEVKKAVSASVTYPLMVEKLEKWIKDASPKAIIENFLSEEGKENCFEDAMMDLYRDVKIVEE